MSYGVSAALQAAVYQRLAGDGALAALVGSAIYDVVPPGPLPATYVSLGPEDVSDRSDKTGRGAEHRFIVSVVSEEAGFLAAKDAAGAVSDALVPGGMTLSRGRLVAIEFVKAQARRVRAGDVRRIDLTFRARVEDDI